MAAQPIAPTASASAQALAALDPLVLSLDPLDEFTNAPPLDPADFLSDLPPFERSAYEIQTVLDVVANELARIDSARMALIQNFFPLTADVLLPLWEELLGLPVNPAGMTIDARQQLCATYVQRLTLQGRGLDWIAIVTSIVGTAWNYAEHDPSIPGSPAAYTINVNIPQALAGVAWPLIRDATPAHLVINEGYIEGFFVGITNIGSNL